MDEDRKQRMAFLKEQIERGDYHVEPVAVARAFLRRIHELEPEPGTTQKECSYPDSSAPASANPTPGLPGTTDPIQVSPKLPPSMLGIAWRVR